MRQNTLRPLYYATIFLVYSIMSFKLALAQTLTTGQISAWRTDGQFLAKSDGISVQIVDVNGDPISNLSNLSDDIKELAWSSDGSKLAIGIGAEVQIWQNPQNGFTQLLTTYQGHQLRIQDIDWNPTPGSNLVATSNFDIHIWDATNGSLQRILTHSPGPVAGMRWSLTGNLIASYGLDSQVIIWNSNDGELLGGFSVPRGSGEIPIKGVAWISETEMVTISENTIHRWLLGADFSGIISSTQYSNTDFIQGGLIADSLQGLIGTINQDGTLQIWTLNNNSIEFVQNIQFNFLPKVNWHPNGNYLTVIDLAGNQQNILLPSLTNIEGFSLTSNGLTVRPLENGDSINLADIGTQFDAIRADTIPYTVGSIVFVSSNSGFNAIDNDAPYELTNWMSSPGSYTLTATPYSETGGTGTAGTPLTIDFTVVESVLCDIEVASNLATALVTAIVDANTLGTSQTLCLEGTYELTSSNNSSSDGTNGLPVITGDITLVGINGGATITRNSASQFRIAKVDTGGRLVLNGITISNGNPGSQNGGGIRNLGTLEVINSTITSNTGLDGGGIRNNNDATLIITNSTISNNTSTGSGGGIRNNNDATLIVTDSYIIDNTSTGGGGGIYSNDGSTTTLTNTTIAHNSANLSTGQGGGLYVQGPYLTITGGVFDDNHARNGGAIFFSQPTSPTVTLNGVSIVNNTVTNHGGGVYVSTGTVLMDNVTISGNEAVGIGGGVRNGANLTIQNSVIENNNGGVSHGGGVANYSSLVLDNTDIIGNYGNIATFLGGAVYNEGTLIVENGSLLDGTSTTVSINARHGGGIYADGGTVNISDSQILNNVANVDGGGIMVRSGTTLNATGVTLDNNTANDDGGGLANEGTFTFTNGSIRNNHAADRGGGVDSTTATNNFIHYSCLEGNTAANRTAVYSGVSNFDATNNWWGSTSGATSSQVNSNVVKTPFVNSNCADALAMGGGAMAVMQSSSTITTLATVSAPYETIFDERAGWLRSGTWALEANGGRASTGWVVDATIRNMISTLEMPVFVNLGNNPSPRVRYWQRGILSNNDMIVLEILPEGASTWTILDQQTNFNSDWTQREIDLSAYRGQAIRLRWRLTTTGDVPAEQSSIDYAIDDLQITSRR